MIPFALHSELVEAASNHGYRGARGESDGWLFFASQEGVPGEVALAVADGGGAWFLAVEHGGVAAELAAPRAEPAPGNCHAAFAFATQGEMRAALHRAYQLAVSLPSLPLARFEEEVAQLGNTEIARITRQRVGQDIFRAALMRYWPAGCPLTGITDPALLRGSHIIPWAECGSDAERLDVHNGLLLSSLWDAAFDAGLVSFTDEGRALVTARLDAVSRAALAIGTVPTVAFTDGHRLRLAWHRTRYGF
ncbi:HNH endonuclease [Sphingomonas qilianensis]|uniref:HNH endonuclease n=1 Tax=Sphingomonas qilianensis TaxID=1736690 RepID=A0ABU9XSE5_9SPHN